MKDRVKEDLCGKLFNDFISHIETVYVNAFVFIDAQSFQTVNEYSLTMHKHFLSPSLCTY